jgi:hypothetical protein
MIFKCANCAFGSVATMHDACPAGQAGNQHPGHACNPSEFGKIHYGGVGVGVGDQRRTILDVVLCMYQY